ncbi:MAG: hypothetical protein L0241_13725, partial [Planctomycetia bacterium]|nr:hypothetical protein [Planctomycetia bacterium]
MATSLKLYLRQPQGVPIVWFRHPDGSLGSLVTLRLIAYANFMQALTPSIDAGGYAITECIVDTGSPYSIISDALWKHFKPGVVTP